ncbi:hypothetical protein GCM10010969_26930 [Saccharibacillus kuerlensis]|uniref:Uncharacterized protein n=1 Tax=Saccharibacillus kuerlensis TaxID=459527 RepID=A0ABQ2L4L9_9BACL|nr:hypothetical protein GCM10010969_26930 [Saccharibacillus kuerlensis]
MRMTTEQTTIGQEMTEQNIGGQSTGRQAAMKRWNKSAFSEMKFGIIAKRCAAEKFSW